MDRRSFLRGLFATVAAPALRGIPAPEIILGPDYFVENAYLIRSEIWAKQIKLSLLDELTTMKFERVFEEEGDI